MARTRAVAARVPEDLEARARSSSPDLADLPLSTLVRVGLACLAGHELPDAIRIAEQARQAPGPKPSADIRRAAA
jgi:hypothetical protein